ncbi:hypothetical protein C6P40_002682 [Pichia californica]|uniref:Uncharacterized protein n=1 Tax=Pichia californica TaxID=460514 RepID=A0A9P7BHG5_9ASCO|nr:hypothetical protein C6P42_001677 [[Candida] californica]KAG0691291.1 hypothetical protein C6P40_002682 [[Candida] californica]
MSYDNHISSIDLGLPLEAQVLSQFFDPEFIPSDYINALIITSLNSNSNNNNQQLNNKSNELYSASSLKLLFKRCSALSIHFNEYTNELSKRFDQSYENLYTSSSQIISYDQINNNNNKIENEMIEDNEDEKEIVTRLQYHLATLNTSMYSLFDELKNTREKLNNIDPIKNNESNKIKELNSLLLIKNRIEKVQLSFNLLKSIVASSEIEDSENDLNNIKLIKSNKILLNEFKNALLILQNLMKDQISQEIELINKNNLNNGKEKLKINLKLIKIIDNMINLQPIFKSFINFQSSYSLFVEFLKEQKENYLNLFKNEL